MIYNELLMGLYEPRDQYHERRPEMWSLAQVSERAEVLNDPLKAEQRYRMAVTITTEAWAQPGVNVEHLRPQMARQLSEHFYGTLINKLGYLENQIVSGLLDRREVASELRKIISDLSGGGYD